MKKLTTTVILMTSAFTLTAFTPALTTFAAQNSNPTATTTKESNKENTNSTNSSESLKDSFDQYVKVENNKFVLEIPQNVHPDSQALANAQKSIDTANSNIASRNGSIDPNTKEITYSSNSNPSNTLNSTSELAASSSYTTADFWWGTRYYFESNDAVYAMDHDLDTLSAGYATLGALGSLETAGAAAAVGTIGAAYFQKVKSDLDYMNNTHPNNYLYMDVNYTGIYSINVM